MVARKNHAGYLGHGHHHIDKVKQTYTCKKNDKKHQ